MLRSQDQLGDIHEFSKTPERIVSIVPSQTELLYDLGLDDRVVGITKFCIHPDCWFRSKRRIGGTKNVNINKVLDLQPDLIIGNKEENTFKDIEVLREIAPVWMSDIYTIDDALQMIREIGNVVSKENESSHLISCIEKNFSNLASISEAKSALYLIWKDPFMGAANNTFIDHVLTVQLGFVNALGKKERYPAIELTQIDPPDFIFLSTEPYPFNESHIIGLNQIFPESKIVLVDGEYFTWYGSRLKNAPNYFSRLIEQLELH